MGYNGIGKSKSGRSAAVLHDTTDSPLALYQLDGDLTDTSGNTQTALTANTGTVLDVASNVQASLALEADGALRLQATDAFFALSGDMTIECLLKPRNLNTRSNTGVITAYRDPGAGETYWQLAVNSSGQINFGYDGQAFPAAIVDTVLLTEQEYTHVAVTREDVAGSFTVKIFFNGELMVTEAGLGVSTASVSAQQLHVAGYSTLFYEGMISSLRIYDSARTEAQVLAAAKATNPQYF